jgi:hypothetical protein
LKKSEILDVKECSKLADEDGPRVGSLKFPTRNQKANAVGSKNSLVTLTDETDSRSSGSHSGRRRESETDLDVHLRGMLTGEEYKKNAALLKSIMNNNGNGITSLKNAVGKRKHSVTTVGQLKKASEEKRGSIFGRKDSVRGSILDSNPSLKKMVDASPDKIKKGSIRLSK